MEKIGRISLKFYFRLILLTIPLFFVIELKSQYFESVIKAGGTGYDAGSSVIVNQSGDIFATGIFQPDCMFDSITLGNFGGFDIYLSKYNKNGKLEWVKTIGGPQMDYPGKVCFGKDQMSIYLTGVFLISLDFGDTTIYGNGAGSSFIAKYDIDGNLLWVKLIDCTYAPGINIDYVGNDFLYVCGGFKGLLSFNGDTIGVKDSSCIFLAKLDSNGNKIWIKKSDYLKKRLTGCSICHDTLNNIYLAGIYGDTLKFDNSILLIGPREDGFIYKLNENGNLLWSKRLSTINGVGFIRVSASSHGELFLLTRVYGLFSFGIDTYEGIGTYIVASFDFSGNFKWYRQADAFRDCRPGGITTDQLGNLYLVGGYQGQGYFGRDTLPGDNQSWKYNTFIVKYSSQCEQVWVRNSRSMNNGSCIPEAIFYASNSCLYFTGDYHDSLIFDRCILSSASNSSSNDIFVVKFNQEPPIRLDKKIRNIGPILYPNPTKSEFTISNVDNNELLHLQIYDLEGRKVYAKYQYKAGQSIDIEDFAKGVYFISIYSDSDLLTTAKLVKQ